MTTVAPTVPDRSQPTPVSFGTPRFAVVSVYAFLNVFLFGAICFETAVMYPDQFHDVPRSLDVAKEFMSVVAIGDFMRPAGMLTVLAGVAALVAVRRLPVVRLFVGIALGTLVAANFVFSVLYFWPANAAMFDEGLAVHTADELRAIASAFVGWNVARIGGCAVGAIASTCAFVRFHTLHVRARAARG